MADLTVDSRVAELFDLYIQRATSPGRETLTDDEACEVYDEVRRLTEEHPQLQPVFYLLEVLRAETARGTRCSVCAKVNDPGCILGC